MSSSSSNPFDRLRKALPGSSSGQHFYDVSALDAARYAKLPFSVRVLLESAVRGCDGFRVKEGDVEKILDWGKNQGKGVEVPFLPARVILQDFTGK